MVLSVFAQRCNVLGEKRRSNYEKSCFKSMGLLLLTIFLGACQAQNAATPSNQKPLQQAHLSQKVVQLQLLQHQTKQLLALVILAQTFLMQHRQLFWMVLTVSERFDEVKALTIKDENCASSETKEYDGEIDIDPVKINADKQIILIGDDMKTYQLDGNQLTLTEGDGGQQIWGPEAINNTTVHH